MKVVSLKKIYKIIQLKKKIIFINHLMESKIKYSSSKFNITINACFTRFIKHGSNINYII